MIISPQVILEKEIVTNIRDIKDQVQQNGIDLTLKSLKQLDKTDINTLTLSKREHVARTTVELDTDELNSSNIFLGVGIYDIEFNEQINIPNGMMAQIFTRSTVNRGGNYITAGLYDAGYKGVLGAILHVNIPLLIEANVKLAQIAFSEAQEGSLYEGIYNEKVTA